MPTISKTEPTSSDDYKHTATGAHALLFHNGRGQKALRLEIDDLEVEFTDSVYIGTGRSLEIWVRSWWLTELHAFVLRRSRRRLLLR